MTTQEVATRLVELCREGKIEETQNELFAESATSTEAQSMDGSGPKTVEGLAAIKKKGEEFNASLEGVFGSEISEPTVSGKYFSIAWTMDAKMKGMDRMKMEEICVYKVENGKIVSEQFFY